MNPFNDGTAADPSVLRDEQDAVYLWLMWP
jgi:hypothetical protein